MPGKLRALSGPDVIRILTGFGFEAVGQRGSHVKLERAGAEGQRQILHVPKHRELRTGTLRAIFRQASQFIPAGDLRPHFFSE